MVVFVTGGSGCGKSAFAESVAQKLNKEAGARREENASSKASGEAGENRLIYVATMPIFNEDDLIKVERHHKLRAGKGFETLERYTDLAGLCTEKPDLAGQTVLVECLSNLTANEIFEPEGAGPENAEEAIVDGVRKLADLTENLIVVSLDVFGEGRVDGEAADAGISEDMTDVYIRVLGRVNARLAQMADTVTEVVYSIPVRQK